MEKQSDTREGQYSISDKVFMKSPPHCRASISTNSMDMFLGWILRDAQRDELAHIEAELAKASKERQQRLDKAIRSIERELKYRRMGVIPFGVYLLIMFFHKLINAL
jgi:hypothetical protein